MRITLTKTHKPANLNVFTYFSVGVSSNCSKLKLRYKISKQQKK